MDIRKTLDTLCSMAGPSGFERAVAEQAVELMRPYVDEAAVDRFGNAIGVRLCGRPGAKKLLLDAHLEDVYKRQGLCSAALCLCALLEYAAVPALVRLVAPLF